MARFAQAVAAVGAGLAMVAASPAAAQEAVSLRPSLRPGHSAVYEWSATLAQEAAVPGGERARSDRLEQSAVLRATVMEVDRAGQAHVRVSFDRIHVTHTGAVGEEQTRVEYAWPQAADAGERGDGGAPEAAPEDKAAAAVAAMYRALAERGLDLRIDPDGTVRDVFGPEEAMNAGDPLERAARARALGALAPEVAAANLSAIWRLDPGRARSRRAVGDSWAATRPFGLGSAGRADNTVSWSLAGVEGGVARLEGTIAVEVDPPPGEPDLAQPVITIAEQEGRASARWDVAGGSLLERQERQRVVLNVRLPLAQPIEASPRVERTLTIRQVVPTPPPPDPAREAPDPPPEP